VKIPTLETLLTDARFFGLTTATHVQRAKCRLVAGAPLRELALDPDVQDMIGGDVASELPGVPPAEVLDISASRVGKTLFGAVLAVYASQTIDVSLVSLGDIIRFHVAALKLDGTRPFMSHLLAHLEAKPALRSLVVGEPTLNQVNLRHPSGHVVEIVPVPIDRAGGSALSVFSAGAFVDEFPRMLGALDAVKNVDHFRDGYASRPLPGAQFYATGSPWAPFGPAYDAVTAHFGRPSADLVVLRTTGRAANPLWWTEARCQELQRRNPTAYQTDERAQFADRESAMISATDYDAAARTSPSELEPAKGASDFAAIDPAARSNAFTLIVGRRERRHDGTTVVRVCKARQWVPRGRALDLELVFSEIAREVRPHGIDVLHSDQFSIDSNDALARRYGLRIKQTAISSANKFEIFAELAVAIAARRYEPNDDAVVRNDVLSVRRRVTQSGLTVHLPASNDGRHADYASAAALLNYVAAGGSENPMNAAIKMLIAREAGEIQEPAPAPPPGVERPLRAELAPPSEFEVANEEAKRWDEGMREMQRSGFLVPETGRHTYPDLHYQPSNEERLRTK
jgi:hypothetical protein